VAFAFESRSKTKRKSRPPALPSPLRSRILHSVNKPTRLVAGILGLVAIVVGIIQVKSGWGDVFGRSKTPQEKGDRVVLTKPACSLHVPKGWEQKPAAQGGIMFSAPPSSGYAANLIVSEEPYPGTLREYVDITIETVKKVMPSAQPQKDAPFVTDANLSAARVVMANKVEGKDLTQILYFFDVPGSARKFVATASMEAKDAGDLTPLFDACLKTMQVK
jgi:hypothetical protein